MDRKTIILEILKCLRDNKAPSREDFGIELEPWGEIAELIRDEGFAKSINVNRGGQGNKVLLVWYSNAKITLDGLEYIENNNTK